MIKPYTLFGWLILSLGGSSTYVLAAEPFLPSLLIAEVESNSRDDFIDSLAAVNLRMSEQHGVVPFLRYYQRTGLDVQGSQGFILSPADSFATAFANLQLFAQGATIRSSQDQPALVVQLGVTTYLQAIRFDGTNTPGWLNNIQLASADESALLAVVEEFAQQLEGEGIAAPMINVFRVVAGEAGYTHLVSINTASSERLAMLLDAYGNLGQRMLAASPQSSHSILSNSLYFELLP